MAGRRGRLLVSALVVAVAGLTPTGSGAAAVGAPDRPKGLEVAEASHDWVSISWDDPDDASITGYQILRRDRSVDSAGTLHVLVDDTGDAEVSFTDDTVEASGSYTYRIKARNSHGLSPRSRNVRADTLAAPDTESVDPFQSIRRQVPPDTDSELARSESEESDPEVDPVWSSVLSVGAEEGSAPLTLGYSRWSRMGSLSSDRFVADDAAYRVFVIAEIAGGLYLAMQGELESDFVLNVGDARFVGSQSLVPVSLPVSGTYWWPSTDSALGAQGDSVDVSITMEGSGSVSDRAMAPPGAYFTRVPESHDGSSAFELRVNFDENNLEVDAAMLADEALEVTGGSISDVRSATSNRRGWTVTVVPDGTGDVSVELAAASECVSAGSVCAADGRMLRNHAIATIAAPAEATALSELDVGALALSPAFDPDVSLYSAQAAAGTTQVTVTAQPAHSDAAAAVGPADADPNTAGHQVALAAGAQTVVTVTVTSDDGSTGRYWVVVSVPAGADAHDSSPLLNELQFDGLAPVEFDSEQARYELTAEGGVSEATVVMGLEDTAATVDVFTVHGDDPALTLDSADADPNAPGHQFGFSANGDTLVLVRVTSGDGQRQRIYLVLIHNSSDGGSQTRDVNLPGFERSLSALKESDIAARNTPAAVLSTLSLGTVDLSPAFAAGTTSYTAAVTADVSHVTVSATAAAGVSHTITPSDADANTAGHQIELLASEAGGDPTQTVLAVIVSNTDGVVNVYLVTVSRAAPPSVDATLSALDIDGVTLTPAFASDTQAYTASVPNATDQITVTAESSHDDAVVAISPADADTVTDEHQVDLVVGANAFTVDVTAADGVTTLSYSVTVTREPPDDDATLSALGIDDVTLSPAFASGTQAYTASVASEITHVTLRLTTAHTEATALVVPADTDSLTDGHQIALTAHGDDGQASQTNIAIIVTAADSTTRHTYAVTITRAAPPTPADITATLPDGCVLKDLNGTEGEWTQGGRWRPACRSILEYYESSHHRIRKPGYAHFYRLDLQEDSDVTINMTDYDTSHSFVLRSADGSELAHTLYHLDDGPGSCIQLGIRCSSSPSLTATLSAGGYVIETVQHFSLGGRQRAYEFEVVAEAADPAAETLSLPEPTDIPADTTTTATVAVDGSVRGAVQTSPDRDWYAVELTAGNKYRIDLKGKLQLHGSLWDPEIYGIHSSTGSLIADTANDNGTAGRNSRVYFHASTTGTHFISVGSHDTGTGTYTLFVTEIANYNPSDVDTTDDYPADTTTSATVEVGGSLGASVDYSFDLDWIAVDLVAGHTYNINIRGRTSAQGALVNPFLEGVYTSDGTLLSGSYSFWGWYLGFQPGTTGTYYIAAGHETYNTGTYSVFVTRTN